MNEFDPALLLISFVITWGIGLTPPLLIRYIFLRRPLSIKTASWIAAGFSVLFWIMFILINTAAGERPGSGFVWVVMFFVARWIMSRGPLRGQEPPARLSTPAREAAAVLEARPERTSLIAHSGGARVSPAAALLNRGVIAREWLVFLAAAATGLVVVPPFAAALEELPVSRFYSDLVSSEQAPLLWFWTLCPYLAVQLFRSAAWAIRQLRG